MTIRVSSISEQVAAHLREGVLGGCWVGAMPGRDKLAADLGVSRKTVQRALEKLEDQGILVPQGAGRQRRIVPPQDQGPSALRVAILASESMDQRLDYMIELQHELLEAGHTVFYLPKSMVELGMDVGRIARMVEKTSADGWVVVAGSFDLLSWFSKRKMPAFALFGRLRGFRMAGAGPDKPPALAAATRRLIELGHRRIVLLARRGRRLPQPGASEQAFLDELSASGIEPTPYHLPDWEVTTEGFYGRLEALFQFTKPTALIVDEAPFFVAAQQFLARKGLMVPEDVSMVCTDADPTFVWCQPSIAHIRWDSRPVVRRIVRWADNVSRGKEDKRKTLTPAEFIEGGTIGPVKDCGYVARIPDRV